MKIVVTGGLGLIGHNVVCKLEALGHQVAITDTRTNYGIIPQSEIDYLISERLSKINTTRIHRIDISDPLGIDWLFNTYQPEAIIHLATSLGQKLLTANPL